VGHKKTVGNSPTCTPPQKIRQQFLGRMHTLLSPRLKLLVNIPGLPYCPMPSDQLLWLTPQPALPARYRRVTGALPAPPIVEILKSNALSRDFYSALRPFPKLFAPRRSVRS